MRVVGSRGLRDRQGVAAALRDTEQGAEDIRGENDHAIAIPRTPARRWSVASGLCRPTRHGNFLEFALREETKVLSVVGPERERRTVRSWDWPRFERIDGPHPEAGGATLIADES